jgi:electron transfer flavoprotein beta subunit
VDVKVVVLLKQTPDTAELPKVTADEVRTGQVKATMVINPWDEFAAEEAILLADRFNAKTTAISLGAPSATDALKHALAMGVHDATLIEAGADQTGDPWRSAALLAAAVQAQGNVDLILTGKQSVDANNGVTFVGVATKLGYRLLTNVVKILDIAHGKVTAERQVEGGLETVESQLPAVISVAKEINNPRYPSFMGIRKANKANIPTVKPADLGITLAQPLTQWRNIRKPEVRQTQVQLIDGATVQEKAAKLVDVLLAEKVI